MDTLAQQFVQAFALIAFLAKHFIYWAPFVLGVLFWKLWRSFLEKKYISGINWVILEVKLPKDIKRSPLAMELLLNGLYQTSSGPWTDQLFKGRVQDWFSLEIVSIEGSIHFFIRANAIFKNFIESQIYAQYPSAEVFEVSDYAKSIKYDDDNSVWQPWGLEYKLKGKDYLPIATYIDFGLDKEGIKDEERVDPLTTMLELFGTCKKDEQMWLQIVIKVSGNRYKTPGTWFGTHDWVKEGELAVEKINAKYTKSGGDASDLRMTESDKNMVKAIGRNTSKIGFDVGVRGFYWCRDCSSKNKKFDPSKVKGLVGLFRPFQFGAYNLISIDFPTDFDFPWQDINNIRRQSLKRKMFDAYKRRSFFYLPYKKKPFVLNSEELATIYHFPGMVAETPTFGRIESRKGEPPTNLPV
jgi:hypothetical protein